MNTSEPLIVPPPVRLHPPPNSSAIPKPPPVLIHTPLSPSNSIIYPKSPSTLSQHWTTFGKFQNKTFTNDFCHQNHLTLKAHAKSYGGSIFKIKQTLNISPDNHHFQLKDNIRILFPLNHYIPQTFQFRVTDTDSRLHVDNGIVELYGHNVNFYGSVGFWNDWSKWNFKVGGAIIHRGIELNSRLKWSNEAFTWYHKILLRKNQFRFGFIGALDLTNRELIKKDVLVGYYKEGLDVSVKLEDKFEKKVLGFKNLKDWYESYTLTATYQRTEREKYGVEVVHEPLVNGTVGSLLVQYLFDRNKVKGKLDSNGTMSFVVKSLVNDLFCVKVGTQFSFKNKNERKKLGVELMFNI